MAGQVERCSDRGAAPTDASRPADLAAVAGEGRNADQGGDLAPAEVAELGEVGEQRARDSRSDGGKGLEEVVECCTVGVVEQDDLDACVECLQVLPERSEERGDQAPDAWRCDAEPVLLGNDKGEELPAAGDEIGEKTVVALHDRAKRGLDLVAEEGQQPSVEGVGLGEQAHALAEAPHSTRVDELGLSDTGSRKRPRRRSSFAAAVER